MKYLLIIFTIFYLISCSKAEVQKIQLNQAYNNALQSSQLYVYQFQVNSTIPGKDIVATVQLNSLNNFLEVYISTNTTSPSYNNSEIQCFGQKVAICSIPEKQIMIKVPYYVAVNCYENCGYQLSIQYVEENFINLGDYTVVSSPSQNSLYILKLYLPPDNGTIDNVVIQMEYINFYHIQKPIYAYMNKGNVIPKSDYSDFVFVDYLGDKSYTLQRKDREIQFDSNYTILIDIPENATIVIETQGYKDFRSIYLQQYLEELIDQNLTRTYRLQIEDSYFQKNQNGTNFNDEILSIYLYAITGDPQIYVDLKKNTSFQKSQFSGTGARIEQINIFPDQRPLNQSEFYITVYNPNYYSTYYLWTNLQSKDDNQIYDFDFPIIGNIKSGSIQNFKFYIQNYEDIDVYIDLQMSQGSTHMYLKRCSYCNFTQDEIKNRSNNTNDKFFRSSTFQGNSQIINFRHDSQQCKNEQKSDYCQYDIGLLGKKNESHYTLNIKLENKLSTLRESDSSLYEVRQEANNFYKFQIPQFDKNVTRIKFVATCISGDISLTSSKSIMNPSFMNNTYDRYGWEGYIEYLLENETDFSNQTFYLGVYGYQESFYQLSVFVERNNKSSSSQVYLNDDIPQVLYFQNENDTIYFTFRVNNQSQPNITLYFYTIYGQFDIYLSTFQAIDMEVEHMWESSSASNNIIIKSSSQSYSKSGIYYGKIVPKKGYQNYQFKIGYTTSKSIQTLKHNEPFKDYINSGQIKYFRFQVKKNHTYQITNSILNQNKSQIQTYLSISNITWPPTIDNNDAIIRSGKPFNVTNEMVDRSCSQTNHNCHFYLAVNSTISTYFTLLVFDDSHQSIQLYDGMVQTISYPSNQTLLNFYFYYDNQHNVVIEEFSKLVPLKIYVNIVNSSQQKNQWLFPNKTANILLQSQTDYNWNFIGQRTVQINKGDFPQCIKKCVVLITIAVDSDLDEQLYAGNSFEIAIYSKIKVLTEGNPVQRNILEGQSDYFLIYVKDDDKTLRITATPLDNNCNTQLSLNQGAYNYSSDPLQYGYSDQSITISKGLDLNNLEGFYTVKVYGKQNGTYQISYNAGNYTYLYMYYNQIQQFDMKVNEVAYIEYYHSSNNSFKILTQKESGNFYIEANSDKNHTLQKNLNDIDYYWTSQNQNNREYLKINKNNSNFCNQCFYLIKITCTRLTNFNLIIQIKNFRFYLPDNKVFKDYLDPFESQMYNYYHYQTQNESLVMNVNVLKGQIVLMEKQGNDISNSSYDQIFQINETLQIEIPVKNELYMSYIISFLVNTDVESIYTISMYRKRSIRKLSKGLPYFDLLESGQTQKYEFQVRLSNKGFEHISVNLAVFNETKNGPSIYVENSSHIQQKCIFSEILEGQMSCKLVLNQTGKYFVVVQNTDYKNQKSLIQYGIMVSDNDVSYLFPRQEIVKSQFQGQNDYYEIIPDNDEERLMIEAYECYGNINLYLGNNLTELQRGYYDQTASRRNGINHFVYVGQLLQQNQAEYIKVNNQNGVQIIDENHGSVVLYKIKSQLLKKGQYVIYDLISLGNRGDVKILFNQIDQKLIIQFLGVYCDNCQLSNSQIDVTKIQYSLSLDKSIQGVRFKSQCSSNFFNNQFIEVQKTFPMVTSQPLPYQFEIKKDDLPKDFIPLFINIAARIYTKRIQKTGRQDEEKYTFIYNTANFFVQKLESEEEETIPKYIKVIIGVGISLWVIGISILIYMWIRMKRAEKILKFETQESRIQENNTGMNNIELQTSQNKSFTQQRYQGFYDEKQ